MRKAAKYDTIAIKPGGIAEFDLMSDSAAACAKRLARYITSASTVRAYLVNEFGPHAAPSLRCIQSMIDEMRAPPPEPSAFSRERLYDPRANDGAVYAPRASARLVAQQREEPPIVTLRAIADRASLVTAADVVSAVARAFGMSRDDIVGPGRRGAVVDARHTAVALLHARGLGMNAVARHVGRSDHSTVINAVDCFFAKVLKRSAVARLVWESLRPDGYEGCTTSAEFRAEVERRGVKR
jgi:hypothetical protein